MNHLNQVKSDDFSTKNLQRLTTGIQYIYDLKKIFGESRSDQSILGFEMLKEIEKKVEWQLKEMRLYKATDVQARYKICQAKRKDEANERKKEQEAKEQQEKLLSLQKRLESQKRIGRPIMARSKLDKEKKEEVVKDVIDEGEMERQQYYTIRFH